MAQSKKFQVFTNPAGFIEEKFIGLQTPESVTLAVDKLIKMTRQLAAQKKPVYVLVDLSEVPKVNLTAQMKLAQKGMVKSMQIERYDKVAVYGNPGSQIVVNTLALIAGKRDKIRVFATRIEALKWLKSPG